MILWRVGVGSKIGFLPVVGWSRDRQVDRKPRLTDRGLLCLVVARRLLGVASERRWVRDVRQDLIGLFACLPHRSGYGKRVRSLGGLISAVITGLAGHAGDATATAFRAPGSSGGFRLCLIGTAEGMPIIWGLAHPEIGEREAHT